MQHAEVRMQPSRGGGENSDEPKLVHYEPLARVPGGRLFSLRLFRQERLDGWAGVFQCMARELAGLAGAAQPVSPLRVDIAPGKLFDRITILQIKSERMADPAKLSKVPAELSVLETGRDRTVNGRPSSQGPEPDLRRPLSTALLRGRVGIVLRFGLCFRL